MKGSSSGQAPGQASAVSVVVLAGGRSSRFGRDKLAEPMDGQPMLWRTLEAMRGVADDLVVVAAPDLTPDLPDGVRVAHDAEGGGGPLIGVLAGLSAARHGTVLVVGGDMPWARADVLVLLIVSIEHGHDSAALEFDGRTQQLPLALRRDVALGVVTRLVEAGERRLGALLDGSSVIVIAEGDWRTLDPDAWTIRDVDTRDDLPPD